MEPEIVGSLGGAAGVQSSETTPTIESAPAQPSSESPTPLDTGVEGEQPPADEAPPEPRFSAAELAAMSDEELLKLNPKLNDRTQSLASKIAKSETAKAIENHRLETEHMASLQADSVALDALSAEDYRQAQFDDNTARRISNGNLDAAGFRQRIGQIAAYRAQQVEAPTRDRIKVEVATATMSRLKDLFSADPDLKAAVGDWDKLMAVDDGVSGDAETVASFMHKSIKAGIAHGLAQLKREMATESRAAIEDGVAARTEGLPDPVLIRSAAGGSGANLRDRASVHAALGNNEISPQAARQRLAELDRLAVAAR